MTNIPQTAMVFAAGLGTRMLPLTKKTPKPMVEVLGRPLIDYRIDKLVEAGVKRAVVNTYHLPDIIEAHLSKRKDIEIVISREEERLETGGGLIKALPYLGDKPFYIINSDVIWMDNNTPALIRLAEAWDEKEMDALLLLQKTNRAVGYHGKGDFNLINNNHLIRKKEDMDFIFTGIQIFNPSLVKNIELSHFSLSLLFKNAEQENGVLNRIRGLAHKGEWLHIDSIEGIKEAEKTLINLQAGKQE